MKAIQQTKITDDDLFEILEFSKDSLLALKKSRIFITGGTGFFGKWMLQTLISANVKFELDLEIVLLVRNPEKSLMEQPWLRSSCVVLHQGDVLDFKILDQKFNFIIHAATSADAKFNSEHPDLMADVVINGTKRALLQAERSFVLGQKSRFLFISSGAVYGKQSHLMSHVSETSETGPDILNVNNSYSESKRMAEMYCQFSLKKNHIELGIARAYAFYGPYLPLDIHFAAGNFTSDILNSRPIVIKGDGSPYRSYMYPTDLVEWLLKILVSVRDGRAYNVGSDERFQIKDFAKMLDQSRSAFDKELPNGQKGVEILGAPVPANLRNDYVCLVDKAKSELGLTVRVNINNAIKRTLIWLLSSNFETKSKDQI